MLPDRQTVGPGRQRGNRSECGAAAFREAHVNCVTCVVLFAARRCAQLWETASPIKKRQPRDRLGFADHQERSSFLTMHPIWYLVSGLTLWQVYTRVMTRSKSIYLTFDDGPDPEHTPRVLDLLAKHDAKATFFLRGDHAHGNAALARQLVDSGHALGNHSYSHPSFDQIPWRRQVEEIERTDRLLETFDGRKQHLFRPPYGKLSLRTMVLCLSRRQRIALWTHDSLDFRLGENAIVRRLQELQVRAGDILLFHDDGDAGIAALGQVLPLWRAAGFQFASL